MPHVAFPVSDDFAVELQGVLELVRASPRAHSDLLIEAANRLTATGLDHYFLEPLRRVGVAGMNLRAAELGIASARKGIAAFTKRILKGLSEEQLLGLAAFIEGLQVDRAS
jgi:hypothetical protein